MNSAQILSVNALLRRAQSVLPFHETCYRGIIVSRYDAEIRRNRGRRRFATAARCRQMHQFEKYASSPLQDLVPTALLRSQPPSQLAGNSDTEIGLPQTCPGCGALTQELEPDEAGYYSRSRRVVKQYFRKSRALLHRQGSESVEVNDKDLSLEMEPESAHDNANDDHDGDQDRDALPTEPTLAQRPDRPSTPLCDRCHLLIHDSRGKSIAHPSLDALADSIAESPFSRNHVYHVVDAADFPMSVVPDLFTRLTVARPRSQNRRSQHDFSTKPTVSFIITRSDLLGSTKEIVDSMMMYFQSVLRTALGRGGKDMRLGNVHLVSAKRGWWTKELKEDIWKRGGGNWMLGKVNVGKSNLFEVLFPKGSGHRAPVYAELQAKQEKQLEELEQDRQLDLLSETSLLPPPQPESPFPVLPIVSSLPGTTASPIRLPFGNHKGELIDLPGLDRGDLEKYVKPEHRSELVMTHRQNVEQHIIKPGQSLILGGGLIRITPQLDTGDRSTTMLVYSFVPLKAHVTSTEKAAAQQSQQRHSGIESILTDGVGQHMASAGIIELSTDVTKARAGSLLRSGVELAQLPFRVFATDILVEGLGWIELVCQVRQRADRQSAQKSWADVPADREEFEKSAGEACETSEDGFAPFGAGMEEGLNNECQRSRSYYPQVEVFSPKGKHVASRQSLQAWTRWTEGRKSTKALKPRKPRRATARR